MSAYLTLDPGDARPVPGGFAQGRPLNAAERKRLAADCDEVGEI